MPKSLQHYLAAVDQAYNRKAWHGPNLKGALRGVRPRQALWRPGSGRHCIWEIAVHAAYWKYAVRRRIAGIRRGSFALEGSNWFPAPSRGSDAEWRKALALLEGEHRLLVRCLEGLGDDDLRKRSGSYTFASLISGVAMHDVYHAGQIQLLKRLCPVRR